MARATVLDTDAASICVEPETRQQPETFRKLV